VSPFWPDGVELRVRDADGTPLEIEWQGSWYPVAWIDCHWRVHTFWWRETELERNYWQVAMDGMLSVIYQDVATGAWYMERIYA